MNAESNVGYLQFSIWWRNQLKLAFGKICLNIGMIRTITKYTWMRRRYNISLIGQYVDFPFLNQIDLAEKVNLVDIV